MHARAQARRVVARPSWPRSSSQPPVAAPRRRRATTQRRSPTSSATATTTSSDVLSAWFSEAAGHLQAVIQVRNGLGSRARRRADQRLGLRVRVRRRRPDALRPRDRVAGRRAELRLRHVHDPASFATQGATPARSSTASEGRSRSTSRRAGGAAGKVSKPLRADLRRHRRRRSRLGRPCSRRRAARRTPRWAPTTSWAPARPRAAAARLGGGTGTGAGPGARRGSPGPSNSRNAREAQGRRPVGDDLRQGPAGEAAAWQSRYSRGSASTTSHLTTAADGTFKVTVPVETTAVRAVAAPDQIRDADDRRAVDRSHHHQAAARRVDRIDGI